MVFLRDIFLVITVGVVYVRSIVLENALFHFEGGWDLEIEMRDWKILMHLRNLVVDVFRVKRKRSRSK